jgi:PRC-barrel domain protein
MMMNKLMLLVSAAIIGVGLFAAQAKAQGVQQTVEIAKVDVQKVAGGYRASKVIGSDVLNDANERIGKIDDLLVTRDGKDPYAVLSIEFRVGLMTDKKGWRHGKRSRRQNQCPISDIIDLRQCICAVSTANLLR